MVLRHLKSFLHEHNCYYEKVGNEVKDITEEIPFEIPNSWSLCRLSIVANVFTGDSINETEKAKKYIGLNDGYNYIGTKDVAYNHDINYNNGVKIPFSNTTFKIAHKGTPLLCIEGGSAGRKIGITNQDVCFGNKLCAFETIGMNADYLYYYLQSQEFRSIFKANTTGLIGGVSINTIKALPFALPPLSEQQRIAKTITHFFDLLSQIDNLKDKYSINKVALKNKLLSLAIQGKLVAQNDNDEPASVFLEKIHAEKKAQLGKKYVDSYIYKGDDNCYYEHINGKDIDITDEIDYDLPNGWSWCRLQDIGTTNIGLTYHPENICNNGTIVIRSSNIINGKLDYKDLVRVDCPLKQNEILNENDIIICARNGSKALVGKCALFEKRDDIVTFGAFMAVFRTPFYAYVYYYLNTKYFRNKYVNDNSKQINQVTQDTLKYALIPLPPMAEQQRIVDAINQIFAIL